MKFSLWIPSSPKIPRRIYANGLVGMEAWLEEDLTTGGWIPKTKNHDIDHPDEAFRKTHAVRREMLEALSHRLRLENQSDLLQLSFEAIVGQGGIEPLPPEEAWRSKHPARRKSLTKRPSKSFSFHR